MDNTLYHRAAERPQTLPEPDHHKAPAKGGPCTVCAELTESLVRFNGKPAWLCPPCGAAIRGAA